MIAAVEVPRLLNAHQLSPVERVVQAGLLLLDTYGRLPTLDEIVASLKPAGAEPGTGKATVNKYWPAFSEAVGASRKKERWLKTVPAPAEALVLGLLDWAQDHATAAISQERAEIEARATEIAQAHAAWLAEKALFQARISELALLNQGLKDETATLHAEGRTHPNAGGDGRGAKHRTGRRAAGRRPNRPARAGRADGQGGAARRNRPGQSGGPCPAGARPPVTDERPCRAHADP
jgi:hypothetical protein